MASSSSFVRLEVRDQIAMVELNRPERHNAIGTELAEELEATTHAVNGAKEIRVAVLTGSGPSFCSGADMKERLAGAEASAHVLEAVRRASRAVYDIDVPVVAAIRGHAVGAGLELAATCDYRIAEHSAILGLPEVNQGITSGGGLIALASLIPRGTIAKLAYGGRTVDGTAARELGVVDELVSAGAVRSAAMALAEDFARHAREVLVGCKAALRASTQPLAPQQWTTVGSLQRALEGAPAQRRALDRLRRKR